VQFTEPAFVLVEPVSMASPTAAAAGAAVTSVNSLFSVANKNVLVTGGSRGRFCIVALWFYGPKKSYQN